MTEIKEVHIGQLVKSVFDSSGMSVSELARRLHCERTNVYSIFSRYNMDVGLLVSLSKVLKHNFLMIL
ncbi:MAG: helix-turn-helix transcriptional regulator [Bacteroidales bacterium]|nr:helix-turn-helix transcriptional regulator [Bacteroidales bacterium]